MKYTLSRYEAMQAIGNYVRGRSLEIRSGTTLYVEFKLLSTDAEFVEVSTKATPTAPVPSPKANSRTPLPLTPAQERFRKAWNQHRPSHRLTAKALGIKTVSVGPYLSALRSKNYSV